MTHIYIMIPIYTVFFNGQTANKTQRNMKHMYVGENKLNDCKV